MAYVSHMRRGCGNVVESREAEDITFKEKNKRNKNSNAMYGGLRDNPAVFLLEKQINCKDIAERKEEV